MARMEIIDDLVAEQDRIAYILTRSTAMVGHSVALRGWSVFPGESMLASNAIGRGGLWIMIRRR
jgi:hypothetical protein